MRNTICFAAGRSGGHIVPCITLAQQWKQQNPDGQVVFFCSTKQIDRTVMKKSGKSVDQIHYLALEQLSKEPIRLLKFVYTFLCSFGTSLFYLYKTKPKKLISTGSDLAIPVSCAAYLLQIPIELYEVNATPGKTIKLLAKLTSTIAICFASTQRFFPRHKCTLTEYPLRFNKQNIPSSKQPNEKKNILILGGSQGSQFLNKLIKQLYSCYPELKEKISVTHQFGNDHSIDWNAWYADRNIEAETFAYKETIQNCYEKTDLVICRAGAGSLFETVAFKKKMICIPLEIKQTDHQLDNARACAQEYPELCYVVRQKNLKNQQKLYELMMSLLFPLANPEAASPQ